MAMSVYSLPSMEMLADSDGNKRSITIDGLEEFLWSPNSNFFVYTAFPENAHPRVGFIEVPNRRALESRSYANAESFKMVFHP